VADESYEQLQLRLTGLVVKRDARLQVYNPIYAAVFNREWVDRALGDLRDEFYAEAFKKWRMAIEGQKEPFLLRGQTLRDAEVWKKGKQLSEDDDQFLAESQALERLETTKQKQIDEEEKRRLKEIGREAYQRETASKKKAKQILIVSSSLLLFTVISTYILLSELNKRIQLTQIEKQGADALRQFEKDQSAELLNMLDAGQKLQSLIKQGVKAENSTIPAMLSQMITNFRELPIPTRQGNIRSLSWTSDGKILATGGNNGTVKLWSNDGSFLKNINLSKGKNSDDCSAIRSVSWSNNGKILAIGRADGYFAMWNYDTSDIREMPLDKIDKDCSYSIRSLSWTKDDEILAAGRSNGFVDLLNRKEGLVVKTFSAHKGSVSKLNWDKDGRILATGGEKDGYVKLWKRDGSPLKARSIDQGTAGVMDVNWTNDGKSLVIGADNNSVVFWNTNDFSLRKIITDQRSVWSISLLNDRKILATGGYDGSIKLWDFNNSSLIKKISTNHRHIRSMSWTDVGKTLAAGGDNGIVKLWHLDASIIPVEKQNDRDDKVHTINWIKNKQALATIKIEQNSTKCNKNFISLWQNNGSFVKKNPTDLECVKSIDWTNDGEIVAIGGGNGFVEIRNWDGSLRKKFQADKHAIKSMKWTNDGKILMTSGEKVNDDENSQIKLWKSNGEMITQTEDRQGSIRSMSWTSIDGKNILATGGYNGNVKLWAYDGSSIEETKMIETNQGIVLSLSWTSDGKILAAGGYDGSVQIMDSNGSLIKTIHTNQGSVRSLSWINNGTILATSGNDGFVKLWKSDGSLMMEIFLSEGKVFSLDSINGLDLTNPTLAMVGETGFVKVWKIEDIDTLIKKGCNLLNSYLINTPQKLRELTTCQTPARTLSAAPNLLEDSDKLARADSKNKDKAIEGYQLAKKWDTSLTFDSATRAVKLAPQGKR
jgi:WD40 repeat protein